MSTPSHPPASALTLTESVIAFMSAALSVALWTRLAPTDLPLPLTLLPALSIAGALAWRHGAMAAWAAALGAGLVLVSSHVPLIQSMGVALAIWLGAVAPTYGLKRLNLWQATEHQLESQTRALSATILGGGGLFALSFGTVQELTHSHASAQLAALAFENWLAGALGYGIVAPGLLTWMEHPVRGAKWRVKMQQLDRVILGLCAALFVGMAVLRTRHAPELSLLLAGLYLPIMIWSALHAHMGRHATTVTLSSLGLLTVLPLNLTGAETPLFEGLSGAVLVLGPAAVSYLLQASTADRDQAHDRLTQQTRCDLSTGLLTDRALLSELGERLIAPNRPHLGLIGLQISNFEILNDLCGTLSAVQCEQNTAQFLKNHASTQCAARLGAGRYVLVIHAETIAQVRSVAREIYAQLSGQLFTTQHTSLRLQICVGGLLIDRLIKVQSDDCLGALNDTLEIAASVRDPQLFVEPLSQMMIDARRAQQAKLEHVREAMRESRIELFAQPFIDPEAPVGLMSYEVLTRLRDRDGTLMHPPEFLALAVQAQMSLTFDRAVVEQTFAWLAQHPDALRRTHRCSINLTGASVNDGAIADVIRAQRARFGIPAERIIFEISESEVLHNPSAVSRLVDDLKSQGFRIALDDFGTGLATFEYLRRFPLDYIKIDGAFIRNLAGNPIDEEIVVSAVRVARRLKLRTIAEHVHAEPIFQRLQSIGVDFLQGDLFGSPQPISTLFEHFPEFLTPRRPPQANKREAPANPDPDPV